MSVKPLRHFVQITNQQRKGFVEFNFSINDPSLFLEMILPTKAFKEFCTFNDVIFLSVEDIKAVEQQQNIWRNEDVSDISLIESQTRGA